MAIPQGHQVVMPYFMVNSASRFLDFMRDVFNAELAARKTLGDGEAVIHAELRIGGSTIMFADASADGTCDASCAPTGVENPRTIQMFVYVDNADDTYKKALDAGATPALEVTDQEDGRMGGILDPFGNLWWIKSMK